MQHPLLRRLDTALVATLPERLPVESLPAFKHALQLAVQEPWVDRVVVDLRQAAFLDSSAIGLLVAAKGWCAPLGKGLLLFRPGPQVLKALSLVRLATSFPVLDTFPELEAAAPAADAAPGAAPEPTPGAPARRPAPQ